MLPPERDEFIGRLSELAELEQLWSAGSRLITVLGPGGSGKTRLSLHFAHRIAASLEGGLWFCDLSSASTPLHCIEIVARVLDVSLPEQAEPRFLTETLGYALAGSERTLILLDNVEQVIEPARALVETWLDLAPNLVVFVTTRVRLRVRGEDCLELGPLDLPEPGASQAAVLGSGAVQLLLSRARSARRDFSAEPMAPVLAELVTKLEGLPLAIELCAARATALGPAQLLEHLERRFETLVDRGSRSRRQATLRATIEWSWQLLQSVEAQALRQCVVFRGDFDMAAAEEVLATTPPSSALDVLESLIDQSLLIARETPSGDQRYALLESVREFCDEKLEASERLGAENRHADHYLARATSLSRDLSRLALEVPNLTAVFERSLQQCMPERALSAALALEPVFTTRGPIPSLIAMLDAGIDAASAAGAKNRIIARARLVRGIAKVEAGDYSGAVADLESSAQDSDPAIAVSAAAQLGKAQAWLGRFSEAEAGLAEAERRVAEIGDPYLAGYVDLSLGFYHATRRDPEKSLEHYRRSLVMFRQCGARKEEALALLNIGSQYLGRGALAEAKDHFTAEIAVFRELAEHRLEAITLGYLGMVCAEQHDFAQAEQALERAGEICARVGSRQWQGMLAAFRGHLELERGDLEVAQRNYLFATERLAECGSRRHVTAIRASLAGIEALLGRTTRARELLETARSELRALGATDDARMKQLWETIELWGAVLETVRAEEALARGDRELVAQARQQAILRRTSVVAAHHEAPARFVLRLLDRQIAKLPGPRQLRVAHDASWFEYSGQQVKLTRRTSLRLILLELVCARESNDAARSVNELFNAGWPGQHADIESATHRVHVAVSSLRKLGLNDALVTRGEGYALDPDLAVERLPAEAIRAHPKDIGR